MNTKILEEIGLTKGESKVYLALLEHGTLTTGPIAKYSEVTNSKVYKILDRLINKGLVSHIIKGKTKYFQASPPKQVLKLIKSKKEALIKREKQFIKELPFLENLSKKSREKSKVEVFEGFKGLKTVFDEILETLKKQDKLYTLGISPTTGPIQRYFIHFFKKQAKIGFKIKAIFNNPSRKVAEERKNKNTFFKFMPEGIITPTIINIYKNKTIINTRSEKESFFTIVITNKETANSFKQYFNLLWKQAKK